MSIYKVNNNLPRQSQINSINDMVLENEGNIAQGEFNKNEIDQIFTDTGLNRKFLREQSLGHSTTAYTDWSHLKTEDGYGIWKLTPGSYSYNSANQLYFNDLVLTNRGEASSESATAFDSVFLYDGDSGGGYTDNTTEAGTEGGTAFSVNNSTTDYLYIGDDATFTGFKVEWQTRGSNYTLVVEYYNGATWTTMTANTNTLSDNTSSFESDGYMTWVAPGDWATTIINSATRYWIRISTSTAPVTTAKAYYLIPYNNVIALLAMSSSQIQNQDWAWCSFSSNVYVTIRNSGNSAYEGNYFITSSSSVANLKNFFVYNHHYKLDFENSLYSSANISTFIDDVAVPFSHSGWSATNIHAAILEAQGGGGQTNTASNTGTAGTGLYKQKATFDLEFYKINSVNNILTIALDGTDKVDLTINSNNITSCTSLVTVGTIGTGTWEATDVGISYGGTGQSTAQTAIDALTAVSAATNEYVLTKDTGTGNAVWKIASGGGVTDATYVTLSLDATLTDERVLTAGTAITIVDGGAGSTVTISVNETEIDDAQIPFSGSGMSADTVEGAILEAFESGGGGGAPTNATYVVLSNNGTLTDERVLTAGNSISLTDGGAGSTATIAVDETGLDALLIPFSFSGFTATNVHDAIVESYTDNAYDLAFVDGDLSTGVLTVTHNLGRQFVNYAVFNDSNEHIIPDEAVCTNTTVLTVDLTSYGTLSGNWNIKVNA